MSDKPREFWIDDILNVDRPSQKTAYIHSQDAYDKATRPIHVIEHSAYQALKDKLEKAESFAVKMVYEDKIENEKLREQLAVAVEALESQIKNHNTWRDRGHFCDSKRELNSVLDIGKKALETIRDKDEKNDL